MTISPNLFLAILSMDAYNRGYDAGIKDSDDNDPDGLDDAVGTKIGTATVSGKSDSRPNSPEVAAGFYAIAYALAGGETVIAYRGTNDAVDFTEGWSVGAGMIGWNQAALALDFYSAVTGLHYRDPSSSTVLTGHSLGGGLAGFVSASVGCAFIAHLFPRDPRHAVRPSHVGAQ